MSITNLRSLLDYNTKLLSNAELQLENNLPGWISKVSSLQLKAVLQKYADFVQQHIKSMGNFQYAERLNSMPLTSRVMQVLVEDTSASLSQCADSEVKDACLLADIQAINHFKIWAYGTASAFARALDLDQAASVLHEAEINEKQIDDRLSQLAEYDINIRAKAPVVLQG